LTTVVVSGYPDTMTIDELLTPDLDDLLTFRLYLAQLQDDQRPRVVSAADALAACDALIARLSTQRWIAVRGAESDGAGHTTIAASLDTAKAKAYAVMRAKIDEHAR